MKLAAPADDIAAVLRTATARAGLNADGAELPAEMRFRLRRPREHDQPARVAVDAVDDERAPASATTEVGLQVLEHRSRVAHRDLIVQACRDAAEIAQLLKRHV